MASLLCAGNRYTILPHPARHDMSATQPSNTSTRALYLSNWQNLMGIWMAGKLTQIDAATRGPCLGELHCLSGSVAQRNVNHIFDYTGLFRDENGNNKYNQVQNFNVQAWFESDSSNAGTLTTNYLNYAGAAVQPSLQISRCFAAPPNQPFFVVRYTLANPTGASVTFNILDQVHLHNVNSSENVHAWYDATNNALIADMTASGQFFVVLGALDPVDGYQAGNDTESSTMSPTVGGWYSFDANGTLMNNKDVQAPDVDLAFNKRVTVAPGQSQSVHFYIGICETQADADAAIAVARASSGDAWFTTTANAYT